MMPLFVVIGLFRIYLFVFPRHARPFPVMPGLFRRARPFFRHARPFPSCPAFSVVPDLFPSCPAYTVMPGLTGHLFQCRGRQIPGQAGDDV